MNFDDWIGAGTGGISRDEAAPVGALNMRFQALTGYLLGSFIEKPRRP